MKILFAASEIFPFAKTGGLGDVAQSLPYALSKSVDMVSVMPMYDYMLEFSFEQSDIYFDIQVGNNIYIIKLFTTNNQEIQTYFIHISNLNDEKNFFDNDNGSYDNNSPYFGIFSLALVELAIKLNVDIVHLNDWHTALAALWIKESYPHIKTIFTIHNISYQGIFDAKTLEFLGIDKKYFTIQGIEYYDKLSFIKAGIAYSDLITTVSPQYAKEIMSEKFGCGLHNFLIYHKDKLSGILNGIDTDIFNPETDKALTSTFNSDSLDLKYLNKKETLKKLGIHEPEKPLFVMISRLVEQKGFDLLIHNLQLILNKELNLVILAGGKDKYKKKLEFFAKNNDNFYVSFEYDEDYSHTLYGAGDFLLMPSVFEPCGLSQLIAMRYGTIPIVHGVGGLLDTVHENKDKCGKGVVFSDYTDEAFVAAIDRSIELKKDSKKINKIINYNMQCDFSFANSANLYINLYKEMLA